MKSFTIISSYSLQEPVLKNRVQPFIVLLLESGYKVTLVSPSGGALDIDNLPGFSHVQVDIQGRGNKGFLGRALYEARLARQLLKVGEGFENTFSLITIPSMFLLFLFSFPSKINILDLRDLTWEYLDDRKWFTRFAKVLFRRLAKIKINKIDLILVTNKTEFEFVTAALNVPHEKVIHVSNGVSRSQFEALSPSNISHSTSLPVRISYIGNVGVAQNLSIFLAAAKELPSVEFYIVGDGTDFSHVNSQAKAMGLKNVFFTGRVAWVDIPKYYSDTHILYSQLSSEFSGAMPSKLYEYLATGKFIIYGGEGQAESILREFSNNLVVPPNNAKDLISAIQNVIDLSEWNTLSLSNRNMVSELYIREDRVNVFVEKIKGMASE
ncbi:glycosyltransferase [Pseudomonas sp.]|uniref:glycosyltransferase n=1 Tax=Pseudomonas sp. TaxID=306 RepID=UPI003A985E9E